jgi:hypothetical protein
MPDQHEPKLLQALLVLLGVVAIVAGLFTVVTGSAGMPGTNESTANVESELRFYAVFWVGFGVLALRAARAPDRETSLIRGLALFLFLGGAARLVAWLATEQPDAQFLILMALELGLPVFMVWAQARARS